MNISHIAIWSNNPERLRDFYCNYFGASSGERYHNPAKQFHSYFLTFDSGCQLEIMFKPDLLQRESDPQLTLGYTHLAISVGSKALVDQLTEQLRKENYRILGEPRFTGDGCYESVVADPDGNPVEITE